MFSLLFEVGSFFWGKNMDIEFVKLLCIAVLSALAFAYMCWKTRFYKETPASGCKKEKSVEAFEDWLQKNQ